MNSTLLFQNRLSKAIRLSKELNQALDSLRDFPAKCAQESKAKDLEIERLRGLLSKRERSDRGQKMKDKAKEKTEMLAKRFDYPKEYYQDLSGLSLEEKLALPAEKILPVKEKLSQCDRILWQRAASVLYQTKVGTVRDLLRENALVDGTNHWPDNVMNLRGMGESGATLILSSLRVHGIDPHLFSHKPSREAS